MSRVSCPPSWTKPPPVRVKSCARRSVPVGGVAEGAIEPSVMKPAFSKELSVSVSVEPSMARVPLARFERPEREEEP